MLLLNIHEGMPQFLAHAAEDAINSEKAAIPFFPMVFACACFGGSLHGVAMALRKHYGENFTQYYLEWRWWVGAIVDLLAGLMVWPAMPFVPVAILAPLVIVSQLVSSYVIGLCIFRESPSMRRNSGILLAVVGVIGIGMSTPHRTKPFHIDEFWAAWATSRVHVANCIACSALACSLALAHRSTFWALTASVLEGMQYICSRTIADSILHLKLHFYTHPVIVGAILIKGCCILGSIHTQQLGLESDLSRFAGIFLVGCSLFMCIYGTAFFGEPVNRSLFFIVSSMLTLAGIWLLNDVPACNRPSSNESSKLHEQDVEATADDDSIFEGAEQDQRELDPSS